MFDLLQVANVGCNPNIFVSGTKPGVRLALAPRSQCSRSSILVHGSRLLGILLAAVTAAVSLRILCF